MRSTWLLGLFAALYVAVVVSHLSVAYLDFGDGNYLYISRRMADGAMLYRDILAPQPPCHLLVGSALIRLGRLFGDRVEDELYTVRAFSILLHLATMLVIWGLALRLFRRRSTAAWAAALYLVIPVGFWWTLGYQSEPLEMFFLLGSFLLLIHWRRGSLAAAGLLGALSIATNMTAVCYVGWIGLFLLCRDRRRALWYLLPVAGGVGAVVTLGELITGGHYLQNVLFNQVGTFPHPDLYGTPPGVPLRTLRTILHYAGTKIAREGSDILAHEGIFVAASIAGLLLYVRRQPANGKQPGGQSSEGDCPEAAGPVAAQIGDRKTAIQEPEYHRPFVGWYGFWSLMSIGFVSKGATEDYIFTIGEPFVCLFAAYAITALADAAFGQNQRTGVSWPLRAPVLRIALIGLGLIILFARPAAWIDYVVRRQGAFELGAKEMRAVRLLIERYSKPGDKILGAPYYAFLSRRDLVEDYSELFIWQIKYGLERQVEKTTGPATLKVKAIAKALREKTIPVAVINKRPTSRQLYAIGPIRAALDANYRSLLDRPIRTLNTDLDVLVPKR